MPGTTPTYGFRYQTLTDAPDGAGLGEDLANDVEDEIERVDTDLAARVPWANVAAVTVTITPVANTPTSGTVLWGKTLPGTVHVVATALTAAPGSTVVEVTVNNITSTGCTVWLYRTNTVATNIDVIAISV